MSNFSRILIVDDEISIRDVFATMLRLGGFAVETAANLDEAIERATAAYFHIFVLDWNLPGVDGESLCKQLRDINAGAEVLFCSAMPPEHLKELATRCGAYYLSKPFEGLQLVDEVKRILLEHEVKQAVFLEKETSPSAEPLRLP